MINRIFMAIIVIGGIIGYVVFAMYFPAEQRGFGMREAQSPVMEKLTSLHNILLIMCFLISGLVIGLLTYVVIKFRREKNPTPSKTTHNTKLEIVWTIIPVLILLGIAFPSMKLLYFMDKATDAELTLKVIGHQWYWEYEYPDNDITFDSFIVEDDDLEEGQKRLLETDTRVVLPVDTNIRILLTSADVLHAWAVPALGVKIDTVPGRLNETWFKIKNPGVYRGQCSELCGVNHAFMPIVIEAVSKEKFAEWVKEQQSE